LLIKPVDGITPWSQLITDPGLGLHGNGEQTEK